MVSFSDSLYTYCCGSVIVYIYLVVWVSDSVLVWVSDSVLVWVSDSVYIFSGVGQ